jgi:hypothetical protein
MVVEQKIQNSVHFAIAACAVFALPADHHAADLPRLGSCSRERPRHCCAARPGGRACMAGTRTEQVPAVAVAVIVEWKACSACENVVEGRDRCVGTTSRYRAGFCYC